LAKSYVIENPRSKVLIIGSDIVRYSPESSGEPTQGGAAVAFVVSQNPRIWEIEPYSGIHATDVMDFWRPVYLNEALFDGKLSAYSYLKSIDICIERYLKNSNLGISDIHYACFHAPFGKMARKANDQSSLKCQSIDDTLVYNSVIGNSCSASLFICFISLLDHLNNDLAGRRIGFFSYGSGSVAEFFSGIMSENYQQMLNTMNNQTMISNRLEISFHEYELICANRLHDFSRHKNIGDVTLTGTNNHQRIYCQV
jgi:hydroxymethylglutaryl-CoA synthase